MVQFFRSIRVRIAVVYSAIVFGLSAVVLGGVYVALRSQLSGEPVTRDLLVQTVTDVPGPFVAVERQVVRQTFVSIERLVNANTLENLRDVSLVILVGLFPMALVIGWLVAGRALRPIERITSVAREIQATDLSRRIRLTAPDDELKHLADTFDDMLDRIQAGADAQRAFIQETSHELRNPLAVMATNLDVALQEDNSDELRSAARVVRASIDRISHTVDRLLAYGRNEVQVTRAEPVDVARVLEQVAAEFRTPAEARQIELEVEVDGHPTPIGDGTALRQALENLVGNAVRLAPLASTVRLAAGARGTWTWLAVQDEGPGIPGDQQPLIWQRHWRGGADVATARGGLGLAIVRQIAEGHGGTARVHSAPGSGSTFVLWLPESGDTSEPPVANPLV